MTAPATAPRSDVATRLRLASGLVLMAFVCTHLLNHALGIHSLAAMEAGGRIFAAVWRTVPASLLLYAALAVCRADPAQALAPAQPAHAAVGDGPGGPRSPETQGGRVGKFIGDGIMALFGVETTPGTACPQALAGARALALALERLNRELGHALPEPLRIAIGLHVGPVILGEMGYSRATSLTAVSDTVNVAPRLEAMAKELEVQLATSTRLAERAAIDLGAFDERRIEIRGRRRPLRVRLVPDARVLPAELAATGPRATPALARLVALGRGIGRLAP